jgi:hypothetical protein
MAFKQYTRCIEPTDYSTRARYITIASLLAGTPAAMIAVAMGHPACLVIALEITALAGLVAYYHNWLYHRLICLGGDRDCLGAIVSIGGPVDLGLNFFDRDTDYSINLLLQNTDYGAPDADRVALHVTAEETIPYGELIKAQDSVKAIGVEQEGHFATDAQTGMLAAVLHAEFEGDGNYKMLLASKVLLAFAIYALIACIFLPWPADIILGLVIGLISLLGLLLASLLGLFGEGSPSDVNAGDLTDNTGVNESGQGVGADIVYVQGTWVCDTLHERWNEIHPIKICTKMGKWNGDWPSPDIILRLRRGFDVANDPETLVNQALPEYQWQVHPELDGCSREIIL